MPLARQQPGIWRLSLEQIEATVADHLGPGRIPGNQAGPCFSRQVSMYLARHCRRLEYHKDRLVLQRTTPHDRAACHRQGGTTTCNRRISRRAH
jgi:hypothetical protein